MTAKKNLARGTACLSTFVYTALLLLLTTCMKVDEALIHSKLVVADEEDKILGKEGGSKTFKIESNRDWSVKIESSEDWIVVSPMKGSKEIGELTVTVKKNDDDNPRKGSFKVVSSSSSVISQIIQISQYGKDVAVSEYVTIKDIRDRYESCGESELIIDEPLLLKAFVISDRDAANRAAKRDGYIQDKAGNGIAFRVKQSETLFDKGDELVINLMDAKIHYFDYAGVVQLIFSRITTEVIDQSVYVAPKELTIAELEDSNCDGTLIKINNVQFKEYQGLNFHESGNDTSRLLECADGYSIKVKTTKNADFRNKKLPAGSGNIVGIASFCKEKWELQLRNLDDVDEMSNDPSTRF
mgnify:FL=1